MIVGCGRIAGNITDSSLAKNTHAGVYAENSNVNLTCCVDIKYEKAIQLAELFNCNPEQDLYSSLNKYEPDIVSVCTPDNTHFEITKSILENTTVPKVIFLEKPACIDAKEYEELIRLSEIKNVHIVVNHSRRFDEHHQQIRNRIQNGELGKFLRCHCYYYSGLRHNGIHIIDTLSYLFNDNLKVKKITDRLESPYPDDPTLELEMEFVNNSGKIIISSVSEFYYQLFEFDLLFSDYRLRIEDFGERIVLEKKEVNSIGENVLVISDNGLSDKKKTPMQNAILLIVKCISKNDYGYLHGYTLKDIYKSMKTIWDIA